MEVMASRGEDTLRFGPMKPIGLLDPLTGRRPYAVVQLRREDRQGQMWNLVGFQTRMKVGEQARVFRLIPGLESAEFLRWGSIHRNSYLNFPAVLTPGDLLQDGATSSSPANSRVWKATPSPPPADFWPPSTWIGSWMGGAGPPTHHHHAWRTLPVPERVGSETLSTHELQLGSGRSLARENQGQDGEAGRSGRAGPGGFRSLAGGKRGFRA